MRGLPATPGAGRRWLTAAVAIVAAAALLVALAGGRGGSRGSTLSRGPGGWLAARRYLEARGARVTLVSEPLGSFVLGNGDRVAADPDSPAWLEPPAPGADGRSGSRGMAGGRAAGRAAAGGAGLAAAGGAGRAAGRATARAAGPGVLALVFPWQSLLAGDLDEAIDTHLGRGGDLVLAYSGEEAGAERMLGIWRWRQAGTVPLAPWRWRSFMRREWRLRPAAGRPGRQEDAAGTASRQSPRNAAAAADAAPAKGSSVAGGPAGGPAGGAVGGPAVGGPAGGVAAGAPPVRIWAPRVLPELGPGALVLLTTPGGEAAAALFRYHGGRVVVLPADALCNSRLGEAGNADLLESLLVNLGPRWAFDEYHHGLVTAPGSNAGLGRAADLLLAHLVLLYLLAVLALARRQGPAWHEPATIAGSAATFLLGLGALHHRLGHHAEASRLLLRRARELDRGLELPPELDRQAANAGPRDLVEVARQVALGRAGRTGSAGQAGPAAPPPSDHGERR